MANGQKPFGERLTGLLGDPTFNLGLGLLSAGGPSRTPTSVGQNMAQATQFATERERQSMRNQAARQQMRDRQRQREASSRLVELARELAQSREVGRTPRGEQLPPGGGIVRPQTAPGAISPTASRLIEIQARSGNTGGAAQTLSGLLGQEQQQFQGTLGQLFNNLQIARRQGNEEAARAFEQQIQGQLGDDVPFSDVLNVRESFESDSREFLVQQEGFQRVQQGVQNPSPVGDQTLLSGFVQMLDPGARVAPDQGEVELSANAGSLAQRAASQLQQIFSGETLTPQQREDFRTQAQDVFERAQERQRSRISDIRGFAERNNLPVEDVVPETVRPALDLGDTSTASGEVDLGGGVRLRFID